MHRIRLFFLLITFLIVTPMSECQALWFLGEAPLVTVNGQKYAVQDFTVWWENWREKNTPFPPNLDSFIEWQLLTAEAETMELYQQPSFQRKMEIFLRVRSLLILKQEEVEAKIRLEPAELKAQYEKKYTPRWELLLLIFQEEKQARAASDKLRANELSVENLLATPASAGGPERHEQKIFRKDKGLSKDLQELISHMAEGEITQALPVGKAFAVIKLMKIKGPEDNDFESVRPEIEKEIKDAKSQQLTAALINDLKNKFHVRVDEELLATYEPSAPPGKELIDKKLILTDKGDFSLSYFADQFAKDRRLREGSTESTTAMKKRVLNDILAQVLVSWEAEERHYETRPPLQNIYQFYRQHRLIKEFEKRMFETNAAVQEEEITTYYTKNPDEFSRPELVKVAIASLDDDQNLGKKIWQEVISGGDFFDIVRKYYKIEIPVQTLPVDHLDTTLKSELQRLSIGEVSAPFQSQGKMTMIKLIDRQGKSLTPLAEVKDGIKDRLYKEKFTRLRAGYVDQLKAKSTILVNDNAWKKITAEHGEEK